MEEGWAQWGTHPRSKYHYFKEIEPGHLLSACEIYGKLNVRILELEHNPPIYKRCKLCMRALEVSQDSTGEKT